MYSEQPFPMCTAVPCIVALCITHTYTSNIKKNMDSKMHSIQLKYIHPSLLHFVVIIEVPKMA